MGEFLVPHLSGNLPSETDATVVIDKHHVSGRHLLPPGFIHWSGNCSPDDKVRAVVNLFQIVNLLGWQKSPDFLQGPFALDRVLEMSFCSGISSGNHKKDLSRISLGHWHAHHTATPTEFKRKVGQKDGPE